MTAAKSPSTRRSLGEGRDLSRRSFSEGGLGWLLAFPAGYGPIGLWSGLAVGLAAVALMLTLRLYFCASSTAVQRRLGAVTAAE